MTLKPEDRALIERTLGESAVPFLATFGYATSIRVTADQLAALLDAARSEGDVSRGGQKKDQEASQGCGSDHSGSRDELTVSATAALAKKTMTLTLTDEEMAALEHLAKTEATPQRAWVVTDAEGVRYRTWKDGFPCWARELSKATFYARRTDAEAVHFEDDGAWRVIQVAIPPETHPGRVGLSAPPPALPDEVVRLEPPLEWGNFADAVDVAWRRLCEVDDRTSPEEYPDMLLITRDELERAMEEGCDAIVPPGHSQGRAAFAPFADRLPTEEGA